MDSALTGGRGDLVMEQLLQQIMTEQQMQQDLMTEQVVAAALAAIEARPKEQSFTVTHNGTIIGVAAGTITGAQPETLLMTSIYDGVYHEDIQVLRATKEKLWDKGNLRVSVHLRRKTLEGQWIWLVSKVSSFVDYPVPSFVLHEHRAPDDEAATFYARITRTIACLAEALDRAYDATDPSPTGTTAPDASLYVTSPDSVGVIPGLADDAAQLQALLQHTASAGSNPLHAPVNGDKLRQLIEAASRGGALHPDHSSIASDQVSMNTLDTDALKKLKGSADTPSVLDQVSSGPCLNISKVKLSPTEMGMVVAVLRGEVTVEVLMNGLTDGEYGSVEDLVLRFGKGLDQDKDDIGTVASGRTVRTSNTTHAHNPKHHIPTIGNASSTPSTDQLPFSLPLHYHNLKPSTSPCISTINLSCSRTGNQGLEKLSEVVHWDTPALKTLDLSFCDIEERGILAMCRSLRKRKRRGLPGLEGLILSGNVVSYRSAKELGLALCRAEVGKPRQFVREPVQDGYDDDIEGEREEDDEEEDDDDVVFGGTGGDLGGNGKKYQTKRKSSKKGKMKQKSLRITDKENPGLQLLHLASTSLSSDALGQLMIGLGNDCLIRELNIASNAIGADGTTPLVQFLEGKSTRNEPRNRRSRPAMPRLDRIDLSNNDLGDNGTAKVARAISNRGTLSMVDLHLSFNQIGSGGTGTIMNKLLQHNLVTLSLDNNVIGDAGCQLVAGSLPSMHHLSRLNLSFNQIGSRGTTSLMRALIGCESIQRLGLSGNVMKISGAIAMGFTLAQHPRLSVLELDNCCLSQVSQCHIAAGIISNRWVPMRSLHGFQVAPAMDVIGVPEVQEWHARNDGKHLTNREYFSNRRNIQMNTIL